MINNMKKDLAKEQIEQFLYNMKKIGFSKSDTIELLKNIKDEEMN